MPVNRVDCFGRSDYQRCYVLPDDVLTNIPRHRSVDSYGAHEVARGLLVEVCRHTGARPNAVFYAEDEVRELHSWLDTIVLTFIALAQLPDGTGLSVVTRPPPAPMHRPRRRLDAPG